jgi:hypothetical protein
VVPRTVRCYSCRLEVRCRNVTSAVFSTGRIDAGKKRSERMPYCSRHTPLPFLPTSLVSSELQILLVFLFPKESCLRRGIYSLLKYSVLVFTCPSQCLGFASTRFGRGSSCTQSVPIGKSACHCIPKLLFIDSSYCHVV